MKRKVPRMTTDEEAEAFLEQDLSDLDFSQFKPMKFEFQAKAARLNMRLPMPLLDAVKARAKARGVPYTRFIREVLEHTRGNKTRAADILGISRKNLYEKMRRYNIGKLGAGSPALN